MNMWWLLVVGGVLSFLLTACVRRYALSRSLLDVPNERSSHTVPTPRGGGVSIVVSFLSLLALFGLLSDVEHTIWWGLLGAGAITACIGFLDDHGHIPARWRLLAHFASAVWALFWLDGFSAVSILGYSFPVGPVILILAAFYLVWMLNLYNFMDGIDGIASVEAVSVVLCGGMLYWLSGHADMALIAMLLASAVLGFLLWNLPPAKIFMGDAGSGFLGMTLGVMSLQAATVSSNLLWAWLILLGVFIVDASLTLLHRLIRGEKVYQAHRMHAYQHAALKYGHARVTGATLIVNVLWLFPMACVAAFGPIDGVACLLIAYIPLLWLGFRFRAGLPN
ncbi:MAG: glycosyltransferase family 4 protein [Pusillimonas sp.]